MNNGIIIVLNSLDSFKLKKDFITSLKAMQGVRICLVCNSSNEELLEALTEIAQTCENTDVVNANRKKSNTSSVRYGARFMYVHYDLKYLGFVVDYNDFQVLEVLKDYVQYREQIIQLHENIKRQKGIKLTYYQSLFSVTEYLDSIKSYSFDEELNFNLAYRYNIK